jgi:hypothetical protein
MRPIKIKETSNTRQIKILQPIAIIFVVSFVLGGSFQVLLTQKQPAQNPQVYQQEGCYKITTEVFRDKENYTFVACSDFKYSCVNLVHGGILKNVDGPERADNMCQEQYGWKWAAELYKKGTFEAVFFGNTKEGDSGFCPERAIGNWCSKTISYSNE